MTKLLVLNLIAIAIIAAFFTSPAFCSEEDFLGWRSVTINCADTEKAGKISLEASMDEKGYTKFVIKAFAKEFALTAEQLSKLAGFPLESLKTTHEAGYEEIGGYTVHFCLYRYRVIKEKTPPVQEVLYISINSKGLTIAEPRATGR